MPLAFFAYKVEILLTTLRSIEGTLADTCATLGLVISWKKSKLELAQEAQFIGAILDSRLEGNSC